MRVVTMLIATAAVAACVATPARADETDKLTYLTFSKPVQLPGVDLPAGRYRFQLADTQERRRQGLSRGRKREQGQRERRGGQLAEGHMAEVLAEFSNLIAGEDAVYQARACGESMTEGGWEGWIEFRPVGGGPAVRSPRETTQPNHGDLEYWASG